MYNPVLKTARFRIFKVCKDDASGRDATPIFQNNIFGVGRVKYNAFSNPYFFRIINFYPP